jgi:hypothetical protein
VESRVRYAEGFLSTKLVLDLDGGDGR